MNTGQQLYDLSNRLKEVTISALQSKEKKSQQSEQENVEQPKTDKQQTKPLAKEHESDQSLLKELMAIRSRMDAMDVADAQRILKAKAVDEQRIRDVKAADNRRIRDTQAQAVINAGLETTIAELRSELLSQAETEKAYRDQRDAGHEKKVAELKSIIISLEDNVKDLINYQVTTVGVFSLLHWPVSLIRSVVGPHSYCSDSDPDFSG